MRGYQKKVIYLKDTGSHLFDEAYFVVSRQGEEAKIEQSDMVYEANRIIKESLTDKDLKLRNREKSQKRSFIIFFSLGAISALIIGAIALLFIY